jgi:tRNA threonylcarbamoyl adenosine modification protein YjeE
LNELRIEAERRARQLSPPATVLLSGEMGVGKTTFVGFLVAALGGTRVASPTFTLHHLYPTARFPLHHFDLYRVRSAVELDEIGLWECVADPAGVVVIEWPERVPTGAWSPDRPLYRWRLQR